MAQESVKVVVRCRPMNAREKEEKCQTIVSIDGSAGQCSLLNPADRGAPPKCFTFDGAYDVDSTTEQIYFDIVYPIVESVSEGYNGTVFAYGQTGCGKSFSMQGCRLPQQSKQKGIIPRAFEHIFEAIAAADASKYLVHASYLEIYNEDIRDLLADDPKKKVDLKEHPDKGVYVPGLSLHPVQDVQSCEAVMERGWKNRSVGATLMNADSSRSHSVFTIHLEQMELTGRKCIRSGKLNLVDLAGSERQAKTGATGERLREATKINLSLSALGNVISALVDGRSKHIPYRDSKLTRLLQDSLGGNTRTLMLACLSPADSNYDETLSTLRYANRAKNIQNRPCVNEDPKDALLREYREELERLKQLLTGRNFRASREHTPPDEEDTNKVMDTIKSQYEAQMEELRNRCLQEQESKAKLEMHVEQLRSQYESQLRGLRENAWQKPEMNNNDVKSSKEEELVVVSAMSPEPSDIRAPNASPSDDTQPSPTTMAQMQAKALERLQELQEKMLGGEKKHDAELKERRAKRKSFAEKRIRALAEALAKVDDEDRTLLPDYEDINAELKIKSSLVKKAKKKIQALEQEVRDLQTEFEADRTDYLETIRRQDQQLRLLGQILEKVQPCIRRDSNYANLELVKAQSVWDQDAQRWRLPELSIQRTKLPPTGVHPGGRVLQNGGEMPTIVTNYFEANSDENGREGPGKSRKEDFVNHIFKKTNRQEELLNEIPDRFSPASTSSSFSSLLKAKQISNRLANGVNFPTDIRTSRSLPTTSTGKMANLSLSSEALNRKPLRLESLNLDEGPQSSSPLRLETLHLSTGRSEPPRRRFAELLDWPA